MAALKKLVLGSLAALAIYKVTQGLQKTAAPKARTAKAGAATSAKKPAVTTAKRKPTRRRAAKRAQTVTAGA